MKTFQDLGGNGHFFIYKVLLVAIYFLSNLMKNRTECLIEVCFKLLGIPDFRKTLENVSIAYMGGEIYDQLDGLYHHCR